MASVFGGHQDPLLSDREGPLRLDFGPRRVIDLTYDGWATTPDNRGETC